ncbi:hypothetical protein ACQSIR_002147 [Escherichia coli]
MTLTKEWLLKTIAELEEERDAFPEAVNEDAAMALAAMKLALASMTAEPVAWIVHARSGNQLTADGGYVANAEGMSGIGSTPLYRTAPPAPVSAPTGYRLQPISEYDAMCAAMLQVAEPVKTGLTLREGLAAIRNSGIAIDAGKIQAERDALNSPAIPDGKAPGMEVLTSQMLFDGHTVLEGEFGFIGYERAYEILRKIHSAMLAAPQQETKNG